MSWLQVTLKVSKDRFEALESALLKQGALAISLENNSSTSIMEAAIGESPLWPSIKLSVLFNENTELEALRGKLVQELDSDDFSLELIADKNWLNEYKKCFKPISFNKKLCVYPSWSALPDINLSSVLINPGLAFGTGGHPTTALCLERLSEKSLQSKYVVDFGCGSGILALASLKLNAHKALGVDIDQLALKVSQENAILNGLENHLEVALPDDATINNWKGRADIVIANILANPLKILAPSLVDFLNKSGTLMLTGILENQIDEIISHYLEFLPLKKIKNKDGWALLEGSCN